MNSLINPDLPLSYADIVLKLNETGTIFNKRILCVKDEYLFYYITIPPKFQCNNFDTLKGSPKASIHLEDILKTYEHMHHKMKCFAIEFHKDKLMKFDTKMKSSIMKAGINNMNLNMITSQSNIEITDKKTGGKIIRWVFSTKGLDNSEQKLNFWLTFLYNSKLASAQNRMKSEESVQNTSKETLTNSAMIMNQKKFPEFFDEIKENSEKGSPPLKEPIVALKIPLLDIPKNNNKNEKSGSKIASKEEKRLKTLYLKMQNDLKFSWDFRYYILLNQFLKVFNERTPLIQMPDDIQMQLFELMGEFRSVCLEISKELIDDMFLPKNSQRYSRYICPSCSKVSIFESGELLYEIKEKSLLMRVCALKLIEDKQSKSLKHEFKTLKFIVDQLITMKQRKLDYEYYVPLSCKINYKGFVILIKSTPPLDRSMIKSPTNPEINVGDQEGSLILGPNKEGHYLFDMKVYENLTLLSRCLNLRPHHYRWNQNEEPLPLALSILTQIHKVSAKSWMEFSAFQKVKSLEDLNTLLEKLKTQNPDDYEIFYIENLADTFPLEVGMDPSPSKLFDQTRFRPEFLEKYSTSLSSDIFLNSFMDSETEKLDMDGCLASEYLKTKLITHYLHDIEKFRIYEIPISSRNLRESFHRYGINMRYLGEVARRIEGSLNYLKNLCEIEMIGRVCKEIFRHKMFDCYHKFSKSKFLIDDTINSSINLKTPSKNLQDSFFDSIIVDNDDNESKNNFLSDNNITPIDDIMDFQKQFLQELNEKIIAFFNILFGEGKENEAFWKEIIQKRILKKFDYFLDLDDFQNFQGLYATLAYQLNIKMKHKEIQFFELDLPFFLTDFLSFEAEIEGYELSPLKMKFEGDWVTLLEIEKRMGNFDYFCPNYCHIIDQFIETDEFIKASDELNHVFQEIGDIKNCDSIEIVNLLYLKIKLLFKKQNLDQTFTIIREIIDIFKRNLIDDHPIMPVFYSLMAQHFLQSHDYNNALLLFKTSLIVYTRIYGKENTIIAGIYKNMAHIHYALGNEEAEYQAYKAAFSRYEGYKYDFQSDYCEVALKLANIKKNEGKFLESIEYGLSSIEVLEINPKLHSKQLIKTFLLVIEGSFTIKDYSSSLLFIDSCANLLDYLNDKAYEIYQKLLDYVFNMNIIALCEERRRITQELIEKLHKVIETENLQYKNDKEYLQLLSFRALDGLINESKMHEKFSQFIPYHIDFICKNSDHISSLESLSKNMKNNDNESSELTDSLKLFEKLVIVSTAKE